MFCILWHTIIIFKAIALIGDPEVVLLDEPSAGLDPVSRRNLWNVILRTMSHRAVILTTHSMDEAEVNKMIRND
jgi:ABC-type multidrug transport system ATPase subunit